MATTTPRERAWVALSLAQPDGEGELTPQQGDDEVRESGDPDWREAVTAVAGEITPFTNPSTEATPCWALSAECPRRTEVAEICWTSVTVSNAIDMRIEKINSVKSSSTSVRPSSPRALLARTLRAGRGHGGLTRAR